MDAKSVIDNIVYGITNGMLSKVNIREQSVYSDLLKKTNVKKRIIQFLIVTLVFVIILSWFIVFLIQKELFLPPRINVNSEGAIELKQPNGIDHYIYLYNTAKLWDNTGIDVIKGDVIEITYSGSYYSNVADLCEKSLQNTKPSYMPKRDRQDSINGMPREKALVKELALYRDIDKGAQFGSLLYQVQSIDKNPIFEPSKKINEIYQTGNVSINKIDSLSLDGKYKCKFIAEKSGQLYVTVNDIYLFPELGDFMKTDTNYIYIESLMQQPNFKRLDSMVNYKPEIWFNDNIGEVLLNIIIRRDIVAYTFPDKYFTYFYRWLIIDSGWLFFLTLGILLLFVYLMKHLYNCSVHRQSASIVYQGDSLT